MGHTVKYLAREKKEFPSKEKAWNDIKQNTPDLDFGSHRLVENHSPKLWRWDIVGHKHSN